MCGSHDSRYARKNEPHTTACPFTLHQINASTFMIRENDGFGEFPHVYARIFDKPDGNSVIALNDTGVGTIVKNPDAATGPSFWTLKTFLEHTINPLGKLPYLIILSHCHWDHILGLKHFLSGNDLSPGLSWSGKEKHDSGCTVLASASDPSFLTPYQTLSYHSLCEDNKIVAPSFEVQIWAEDCQAVRFPHPSGVETRLDITILHTPGHTPDSLTWYDIENRTIFVGDSLYQQETDFTRMAPWGQEDPGPVMFTLESNLLDWWRSIEKLICFVEDQNRVSGDTDTVNAKRPVRLAAGHVTAGSDAYECLANMKRFMGCVLRGVVPCTPMLPARGEAMGLWRYDSNHKDQDFSVGAPFAVIEDGKRLIPREEWFV